MGRRRIYQDYEIRYIDGHDMRYKVFTTKASCPDWAINNLWDSYPGGDFDHQIISVTENGRTVYER